VSSIEFANRDGWRRWQSLPDDLRERAETATVELVSEMLAQPGRTAFPDWPVVDEHGRDVEWLVADIALFLAQQSGDRSAPMFERWRAALPRARARVTEERAAFLRGGDPPADPNPSRDVVWERDQPRLARLSAPLVLVTKRKAAAA
jgi:hypothetical protein